MALGFVQCLEILVPGDRHGRPPMVLRVSQLGYGNHAFTLVSGWQAVF